MKRVTQLSFLPDNDRECTIARPSVPVAKLINGRWCWKAFDRDEYVYEPELAAILLAAQATMRLDAAA